MRTTLIAFTIVLGAMVATTACLAGDLAPPEQLHGGQPIDDCLVGHTAPFYGEEVDARDELPRLMEKWSATYQG
jgi:hypothetical protein